MVETYKKLPERPFAIGIFNDPNLSKSDYADYSAFHVWAKTEKDEYYLLDWKRGKWGWLDSVTVGVDFVIKYKDGLRFLMTEAPSKDAPDFKKLYERELNQRKTYTKVIFTKPHTDKISRLNKVVPLFQQKKVFFPHPKIRPDVNFIVDQLLQFPDGCEFDDDVDCISGCLDRLKRERVGAIKRVVTQSMPKLEPSFLTGRLK